MAARITEVRDAVKAVVDAAWVARESADDLVLAQTRFDVDSATHAGRKVYVIRSATTGGPAARNEEQTDYSIAVLVVERYADQGDPSEAWVDERVEWCEWLLDLLGDPRGDRLLATPGDSGSGLWPEAAEVTTVCDVEELTEKKLFVSVLSITYREHSEA